MTDSQPHVITALTAGPQVLQDLSDLASLEQSIRNSAAARLVMSLWVAQQHFKPLDDTPGTSVTRSDENVDAALKHSAPLVVYTIKRLARGLASSNKGARQGYAVALTAGLQQLQCVDPPSVLDLVDGCVEVRGSQKGTDMKDALLGRLVGYSCLVRSGLPLSADVAMRLADGVMAVARKKAFLREAAAAVLLELAAAVQDDVLARLVTDCADVRRWLTQDAAEAEPEAMLFALKTWSRLPQEILDSCSLLPKGCAPPPAAFFSNPNGTPRSAVECAAAAVFSEHHLQRLQPLLAATTRSHPRLHPLWTALLTLLIPGFLPTKEAAAAEDELGSAARTPKPQAAGIEPSQVGALWAVVAEEALLASSHERKFLAMILFQLLLPRLTHRQATCVLTHTFLFCLAHNLRDRKSYLHPCAKRCVDRLVRVVQRSTDVQLQLAVAGALQQHRFDHHSRTRTTPSILQGLDAAGIRQYQEYLISTFCTPSKVSKATSTPGRGQPQQHDAAEEGEAVPPARSLALEQLYATAALPGAGHQQRLRAAKFLAVAAFCQMDAGKAAKSKLQEVKEVGSCSPALRPTTRSTCATRLVTLLSTPAALPQQQKQQQEGTRREKDGQGEHKSAKRQKTAAGGDAAQANRAVLLQQHAELVQEVVGFVAKARKVAGVSMVWGEEEGAEEAEAALEALAQLAGVLRQEGASGGTQGPRCRALLHLVQLLRLHLLEGPAGVDAGVVTDLLQLAGRGWGLPVQLELVAAEGAEEGGQEGEPHWTEVLVDVVLSLMAGEGAQLRLGPLRTACEGLFRACAEELTAAAVGDLVRVVRRRADTQDEADEEEDMFEEEGGEEGEEGEEAAAPSSRVAGGRTGSSGGEVGSDDDDEGSDGGLGDRDGLGQAADGRGGEESDDGVGDEAMFHMDAQLATVLRSQVDNRKDSKAKRQLLDTFKLRVISLLDILAKKAPASPLLLSLPHPLLKVLVEACRPSGNPALASKIASLLTHTLPKARPPAPENPKALEQVQEALRVARQTMNTEALPLLNNAAAETFLLLLRSAAQGGEVGLRVAQEQVLKAVHQFFHRRNSRIRLRLLQDVLRRVPSAGATALDEVLAQCRQGRNETMQTHALELLAAGFQPHGPGREVAEALKLAGQEVGRVLQQVVEGPWSTPARHSAALKPVGACVDALKKLHGGKRAADFLGPENVGALAKSVVCVQAALTEGGGSGKVVGQLKQMVHKLGISSVVAATKVDPVKMSQLKKAAEKLAAGKEQAAAASEGHVEVPGPGSGGGAVGVQKEGGRTQATQGDKAAKPQQQHGAARGLKGDGPQGGAGKKRKQQDLGGGPAGGDQKQSNKKKQRSRGSEGCRGPTHGKLRDGGGQQGAAV